MFQININTKSIIILYNHFTTAVSRAIAFVLKIKNHTQDTHYQGILYNIAREKKKKQETKSTRNAIPRVFNKTTFIQFLF